jgi:hypothetical protein
VSASSPAASNYTLPTHTACTSHGRRRLLVHTRRPTAPARACGLAAAAQVLAARAASIRSRVGVLGVPAAPADCGHAARARGLVAAAQALAAAAALSRPRVGFLDVLAAPAESNSAFRARGLIAAAQVLAPREALN